MSHPVVHWEIGGRDAGALREFYAKAFGWTMTDAGPNYTLIQPTPDGLGGGIMQVRERAPAYLTVYGASRRLFRTMGSPQRSDGARAPIGTRIGSPGGPDYP